MRVEDAGNRVISWCACKAQACPEKYPCEEHQNPHGTTDRRSPIRLAHRLAHADQVSSQEIRPRGVALERCFASGPCNAASNGLPGSPPHKVPELNALWTIPMRRKIPSRHSCVRSSTNRQRFVATGAGSISNAGGPKAWREYVGRNSCDQRRPLSHDQVSQ